MSLQRIAKNNWFLLGVCLLCGACEYAGEVAEGLKQEPYFDMPSLVQRQLARLDSLQPTVEIVARVGEREETEEIRKDSANWAETLQLFSEANINRPVLQGSYTVVDSTDQQNNQNIRIYRARQPEDVEIPYLAVYYQDSLTDVRRIETEFHEKNLLYSTSRRLAMQFEPTASGPLLVGYRSEGRQKMILRDSVHYRLQATLRYL